MRSKQDLEALAGSIGKDTQYLLEAIKCCPESGVADLQESPGFEGAYTTSSLILMKIRSDGRWFVLIAEVQN